MKTLAPVVILFFAVAAASADQVIIGYRTYMSTYPFYGCWNTQTVRSQDLVLQEEGLMAGTVTRWEWYASSIISRGYFNNFKLTLCHTGRKELVADFVANYDGRSPAVVYRREAQYTGNAVAYTWWSFDFDTPFEYDGDDNLIVEVFWQEREGGPGVVSYWTPMKGRCCMYAGPVPCDPAVFDFVHYMRVTISPVAVAPTSLGRVKAVFR